MTVHDELGQLLTAIKMDISLLKLSLVKGEDWSTRINNIEDIVVQTMRIVRNVSNPAT
jgi:signal transduction histidine kinase